MNGLPIARIFGVEVRAQLAWVLVLALIGYLAVTELQVVQPSIDPAIAWVLGGIVAIGFFVSSVAHDLAHAVVARRRGMAVNAVAISFFGGSTPLEPSADRPGDDLAIALAGPLASIAIGLVVGAVSLAATLAGGPAFATIGATLAVITVLNLLLGFVNLLPAYPLDGGRIVRDLGWRRRGSLADGWGLATRSGRLTGFAAVGVGVAAMLGGGFTNGAMIALSGWFLVLSSRTIAERIKVEKLIGGLHVEDAMEKDPVSVTPGLTVDTFAGQLLDDESEMTALPVVRDDEVIGVLGVREVRRLQQSRWATTRVEDIMTTPPRLLFLSARDSLGTAVERLHRAGLDGFPVVDGGSLVGMLTRRSIGQLLHERGLLTPEGRTVA